MVNHTLPLVIQNSGGRTSAFMTEECLKDEFIRNNSIVSFQNTGKEEEATLDFIHKCELRWKEIYGIDVVWLEYNTDEKLMFSIVDYETAHRTADKSKPSPFEKLIRKKKYVPNIMARFCTQELKIRTVKRYMVSLKYKHWTNLVGIRHDEPTRWSKTKSVVSKERFDLWMPLVDWKITKPMVLEFWDNMPFNLELKEYQGNCDLCFLKGIGKKRMIMRDNPEKADWWIEMETQVEGSFRAGFTYADIRRKLTNAPEFLFDLEADPDIQCFCNID